MFENMWNDVVWFCSSIPLTHTSKKVDFAHLWKCEQCPLPISLTTLPWLTSFLHVIPDFRSKLVGEFRLKCIFERLLEIWRTIRSTFFAPREEFGIYDRAIDVCFCNAISWEHGFYNFVVLDMSCRLTMNGSAINQLQLIFRPLKKIFVSS